MLGYTRYEILGRRASDYIDPADDLQLHATLADMPAGTDSITPVTLRWRHRNGKTRWLERTMVALRDPDGSWRGVRGIDRDVTLRMAQEVRIRRLNRAQRFLSGASEAAMRTRDRDRLIREACRLAVSVGGYARATIYLLQNDVTGTAPLVCSYGDAQDDGAKWLIKNRLPEGVGAKDIALASLEEASLDITVKNPDDAKDWALKLATSILPTGSLRRPSGGHVTDLAGFGDGAWWVQDASSALPVKLMGEVSGARVLDLCAAPGGKTAQLAASGAQVTALDRSASRMATLTGNIERLGLTDKVQTIIEDGSVWKPKEKFQMVLLDAPCSATGTIRRHPDLLSLKGLKDQQGLMSIQERLLDNAADLLESGGVLLYCTCSLQKDEGERQIERFLASHENFRRIPVKKEEFGGIDGLVNAEGDVRILPQSLKENGGMDGFFISRLKKAS